MTTPILRKLVSSLGFCCPYAFFRSMRGRSHIRVATRLGVAEHTIYWWRRGIKEGRFTCECDLVGKERCVKATFGGDKHIPRVELQSLGKCRTDPFID